MSAFRHVYRRAGIATADGDRDGYAIWKRIVEAIGELTRNPGFLGFPEAKGRAPWGRHAETISLPRAMALCSPPSPAQRDHHQGALAPVEGVDRHCIVDAVRSVDCIGKRARRAAGFAPGAGSGGSMEAEAAALTGGS